MIFIRLDHADFEYDLHSLFKAFYPSQEVTVTASEDKNPPEELFLYGEVFYEARKFTCRLYQGQGGKLLAERSTEVNYVNLDELDENLTARSVDAELRKDTKNRLKRMMYEVLSDLTGKQLPWGTLTGIRPTKIPMKMLEEGKNDDDIRTYMKDTYFASDEKITDAIDIARKEKNLLDSFDYKNGYSLYIGIPFCPTRCLYCSFTSYPISLWEKDVDRYLSCVEKELAWAAEAYRDKPLHTIYMGGGTPTTLTGAQFDRLLGFVEEHFDLSHLKEFTVEGGRPDSVNRDNLSALRRHPVTRISINPQTMNQKTLDLIGRRHTTDEVRQSFDLARELGLDNINMDIILGLPEEGDAEVRHTLEEIAEMKPDSLTVHSLAVKRAARLRMERENYQNYHMDNTNDRMHLVKEYATILGLEPYYLYRQKNMAGNLENVGYATPGKEGLYNILIMEEKQTILSVGAAGMTKIVTGHGPVRTENVKDVKNYMDRVDEMIERKKAL